MSEQKKGDQAEALSTVDKVSPPESGGKGQGPDPHDDAQENTGGVSKLERFTQYLRFSTYVAVGRTLGPLEKFFVSFLVLLSLAGISALGWGISQLIAHPVGDAADQHAEVSNGAQEAGESHGGGGPGEGGGEDEVVIGLNAIPQSIRDRQDGQLEAGQDLVEPQIETKRSLASLVKGEFVVEGPPKYFEMRDLVAGARGSVVGDAVVISDVVLVLSNYEAQVEAGVLTTELRSAISSLVADLTKEQLKTFEGKARLKEQIQREINHILTSGQVDDVLFSKFLVR